MTVYARTIAWSAPTQTGLPTEANGWDEQCPVISYKNEMILPVWGSDNYLHIYRRKSWTRWYEVGEVPEVTSAAATVRVWHAVYGGYLWLLVSPLATAPTLLQSADGIEWDEVSTNLPAPHSYYGGLAAGPDGLLSVGVYGRALYRSDAVGEVWGATTTTGLPGTTTSHQLRGLFANADRSYLYAVLTSATVTTSVVYRIATVGSTVWTSVTPTVYLAGTTTPEALPYITSAVEQEGTVWFAGLDNYTTPTAYRVFAATGDGSILRLATDPSAGQAGYGPVCYLNGHVWASLDSRQMNRGDLTYAAASTQTVVDTHTAVQAEQQWYDSPLDDPAHPDSAVAYGPGLLFDLRRSGTWPLSGCALESFVQVVSRAAAQGESPSTLVAGTSDGYLCRAFARDAAGLGTPVSRTRFVVSAVNAGKTVVSIDDSAEAMFFPTNMLRGLPVTIRYAATGTEETKTILSNTTDAVTTAAWSGTPVSGDELWIAPMECGLLFPERRFEYPARLLAVQPNVQNVQTAPQAFDFGTHLAEKTGEAVTLDATPEISQRFDTTDLEAGQGRVFMDGEASLALAYQVRFRPVGGGDLAVGPIVVEEIVHPSETLRSK